VLVADLRDAVQPDHRALDALELLRVLQGDPVGLRHVGRGHRRVRAVELVLAEELLDLLEGLLLRLEADTCRFRVVLDDLLDRLLLLFGGRAYAGGVGVAVTAQEDRDLELAADVTGGDVALLHEQHTETDERHGHEDGEHHRDVHGDVAAQPLAELAEDVPHQPVAP
jgi:hypothetical protein